MTHPAIQIDQLSKLYRLGATAAVDQTFREMIYHLARRWRPRREKAANAFWALRDISFEVEQGEMIGVVGANGAGKSTLLKVLSGITAPTQGRVRLRGQVSSLLEVGTGFHPELTGRENIYLNGAILGMGRAEIRCKFDDIVGFAQVERFIDTPVKRYSSGMYLRLAFAVAAHLEPHILIIDEVLAVGDAAFQQRCMSRMKQVAAAGRTVMFVSHNLAAVNRLCRRSIWLERGRLRMDGASEKVTAAYLSEQTKTDGQCTWPDGECDEGVHELKLMSVRVINELGDAAARLHCSEPIGIELTYRVDEPIAHARVGLILDTEDRELVFESCCPVGESGDPLAEPTNLPTGRGTYTAVCRLPGGVLAPRRYLLSVNAAVTRGRNLAYAENVLAFELEADGPTGCEKINPRHGIIAPQVRWQQQVRLMSDAA